MLGGGALRGARACSHGVALTGWRSPALFRCTCKMFGLEDGLSGGSQSRLHGGACRFCDRGRSHSPYRQCMLPLPFRQPSKGRKRAQGGGGGTCASLSPPHRLIWPLSTRTEPHSLSCSPLDLPGIPVGWIQDPKRPCAARPRGFGRLVSTPAGRFRPRTPRPSTAVPVCSRRKC